MIDEPTPEVMLIEFMSADIVGPTHARETGEQLASLVRDVELLSTSADVRALANADVQPVLERLMPAYGGERGARAFSAIDRALVALDRNAGVKIVADWLVLQL